MYRTESVGGIKVLTYGKVGNDNYKIPCFDDVKNKR